MKDRKDWIGPAKGEHRMKPLYIDKNHLPNALNSIEGAIRGNPLTGPDGPGSLMSEAIEIYSHDHPLETNSMAPQPRGEQLFEDEEETESDNSGLTNAPVFWTPSEVDDEKFLAGLAGTNNGDYIRQAHLLGVDALGYYLSFHQRTYQWGIYMPLVAVAQLAIQELSGTNATARQKLELAWQFILSHERFHYAADCGVSQMEIIFQRPIWWPVRESMERERHRDLEEKLATAHSLRFVRNLPIHLRVPGAFRAFKEFTKRLPKGYNTGHEIAQSRFKFEDAMLDHAQLCVEIGIGRQFIQAEMHHLYPAFRDYDMARCPMHVVIPDAVIPGRPDMFFIKRIEDLEETVGFKKELQRLPRVLVNKWTKTKQLLSQSVQVPGLDFKNWPKRGRSWFSVRVDQNFRAHLRFDDRNQNWIAEEIGNHAAMGHG